MLPEVDGDDAMVEDPRDAVGAAGYPAPHLALIRAGTPISVLDLMGRDFVLLAGSEGEQWCDGSAVGGTRGSASLSMRYRVGDGDLVDEAGRFEELYDIGPAGAALIRPDGFVAWRTRAADATPEAVLTATLAQILAR